MNKNSRLSPPSFRLPRRVPSSHWGKLGESGQGLTEYIVLLLLVSIVSIAAVRTLGTTIKSKISEAKDHINSDVTLK